MRNRWLGLGVVLVLAGGVWGVGCGSSDSGDGGGAGGAGGSAGTGGTAGSDGGEAGSDGGEAGSDSGTDAKKDVTPDTNTAITCGGQTCDGTNIAGALDVPACCATSAGEAEVCGLDVSALSIIGINPTNPCIAKNQPGAEDPNCPDYCFSTQLGDVTLKGCMNTDTNTCGALANAISVSGITANVDLGCVTPEQLALPAGGLVCGDGGTDGATTDASDDGATDDGATDDGATDDGATDDGDTDDAATE